MEASVIVDLVKALPAPAAASFVLLHALDLARPRTAAAGSERATDLAVGVHGRVHPGTGLAVAGAMLIGLWVSKAGGWSFPPRQSVDWFAVALYMSVLATVALALVSGRRAAIATRVVACAAVATGVSWKLARTTWPIVESIQWLGGLTLGAALVWTALDRLALVRRPAACGSVESAVPAARKPAPAWSGPLVMAVWTMMLSQALAASDSLLLGKVAAMLAACYGAAVVVAIVRPALLLAGGAAGVAALVGAVLIFGGVQYAGLKLWMAVLLAGAPVVAAIADAALLRRVGGIWRAAGRAAAVAILPSVVLAVAIPAALKASRDMGY